MTKTAYDRLLEASNGQDVVVPVRISVLTQLLDLRVRPDDREKLIAHYVEVIQKSSQQSEASRDKDYYVELIKKSMPQDERAEDLARKWHTGRFRKDGVTPEITHPEAVANSVSGETAKSVAWLHDVFEDTDCPITELDNFSPEVREAVALLTKIGGQSYTEYIERIARNPLARLVKIADIKHNLSCQPSDEKRVQYKLALSVLERIDP